LTGIKFVNRHAISLFAKDDLLEWVKSKKPRLHFWTLEMLNHRPSIYTIEMEDQNCHGMALETLYKRIVENELAYLDIAKEEWPEQITYELFQRWFSYQYHEDIYDLCADDLVATED
jgi:hypothetical protein